ncbi:hypothetical protein ACN081_05260 [Rothia sp. P13129]|uniref:hypothetical protein n=1 Tax=Rothia sp. P13129 TaxID=3402664 RepID=UPI003AC39F2B
MDYHFTRQEALGMFFGFKNIRFKLILAVFATLCVQRATLPFNKDFKNFKDFYAAFKVLPFPQERHASCFLLGKNLPFGYYLPHQKISNT